MTAMKQAHRERGIVAAVASGKGGVGKTWFAITLAHALARQGRHVLLFDGDLGLANVDIQLGLLPSADLGAVLAEATSLEGAVQHHEGGFDILTGRSGSGDLASLSQTAQDKLRLTLDRATQLYETVILDLGAGLDPFVRQMARQADRLLVIATDEPTSLTDAYAVLKLHKRDALPNSAPSVAQIVINQAASLATGQRTYATLARACQNFLGATPKLAGVIRRDDHVRDAIRRQTLLLQRHPSSAAAVDVCALADRAWP